MTLSIGTDSLSALMVKMFENSTEAIFFFDREGKTLAMNPAAEEIVGDDVLIQLYEGQDRALCGTCKIGRAHV